MVVLFSCRLEWCLIAKKHKTSYPEVQVWSNASSVWGCGALWKIQWFQLPWGDSPLVAASIAVKELLPILLACTTWGVNWQGCTVCCHFDNQTVVWVINNLNPKDPLLILPHYVLINQQSNAVKISVLPRM